MGRFWRRPEDPVICRGRVPFVWPFWDSDWLQGERGRGRSSEAREERKSSPSEDLRKESRGPHGRADGDRRCERFSK